MPVVVGIILTLAVVGLVYSLSDKGIEAVEKSIFGTEDEQGLANRTPANSIPQTENKNYKQTGDGVVDKWLTYQKT